MQLDHLIQLIAQQLEEAGIDNPLREARLLVHYATQIPYLSLITKPKKAIALECLPRIHTWVKRRCAREPLAKIIGKKEFWGLELNVTADTLDPRPDSETLIQAVLEAFPNKNKAWRILDLGTGTGCLILTLLHEYPNATGFAVDQSLAALGVAAKNAQTLKVDGRVAFIQSNWTQSIPRSEDKFDIIISNPPYIPLKTPLPPEVLLYDPHEALFAGGDGLQAYREIAQNLGNFMHPFSKLFLEIGLGQEKEVEKIFIHENFIADDRIPDLAGILRCLIFSFRG